MIKQELLDEKLVLEQTLQYKLSIQVCLNGFSFCCLDDRTKRYVAVKEYSFTNVSGTNEEMVSHLEKALNEDELLKKEYKEVRCMFISPLYTLVPNEIFVESEKQTYIRQLTLQDYSEFEVFARSINDIGATVVYAVPSPVVALIRGIDHNATFYNQSIPQIVKQQHELTNGAANLSVLLTPDMACFSLIQNGVLNISTTFSFESTSDLVYYTMLLLKEHNLKPEEAEVYLSGSIEKQSPRYSEMSQFLPNIALDQVPKGFEYSYKFKHKAEHQLACLFKLTECV